MDITKYLDTWAAAYRNDLIENIMPFWMKFGLDRKHGGIYTCLDRDGKLMDSTKSVWFQGRFGFYRILCLQSHRKKTRMAGCVQKLHRFHRDSLYRY